jgi:uncharacterized membrane protein
MARIVVAMYDRVQDAQEAVKALVDAGFQKEDVSLVVNDTLNTTHRPESEALEGDVSPTAVGAGTGMVIGGITGLLAGLGTLMIPGIGPVLVAGPLLTMLAGMGMGAAAGGFLGALVDLGIPEEQAGYYAEGVRRGGSLVSIRTADDRALDAVDILNRYSPVDVNRRVEDWRSDSWQDFNENRQPMTSDQIDQEHGHYRPDAGPQDSGVDEAVSPAAQAGGQMPGSPQEPEDQQAEANQGSFRETDRWNMSQQHLSAEDPALTDEQLLDPTTDADLSPVRRAQNENWGKGEGRWTWSDQQMGVPSRFNEYELNFLQHYQTNYSRTGSSYEDYQPAYQYGFTLANDERYRGWEWDRLEPEARREWELGHRESVWEQFQGAVREAWTTVAGSR